MNNVIVEDIGLVVAAMRPTGADAAALRLSTIVKFGLPFYDYINSANQAAQLAEIPYYTYGRRVEIVKRLLERNNDETLTYKKYPLVALGMDIPERVADGVIEFTLNIVFLALTDPNYTVAERYENVFKPILYPMYTKFLEEFGNIGLFMWPGDQSAPPHDKYDRYYWGTTNSEGSTANKLPDPLDAIELLNFKFRQEIKC